MFLFSLLAKAFRTPRVHTIAGDDDLAIRAALRRREERLYTA
jgi:hypothetical protein